MPRPLTSEMEMEGRMTNSTRLKQLDLVLVLEPAFLMVQLQGEEED